MKLRAHLLLLLSLGIVLLLRLPSLFEPYWYGDEGIYLAIGQALQRGALLYRDIWDNKTPLLYLLYGLHPTLLWAKTAATVFVLATTATSYLVAIKFLNFKAREVKNQLNERWLAFLAATLTGIFLSVPLLEGTIANAELFFTLPLILIAYIIMNGFPTGITLGKALGVGLLGSIAFLFKVPALFDVIGMLIALFFCGFWPSHFTKRLVKKEIIDAIKSYTLVLTGFLVPFLIVCTYFYTRNGLLDFLIGSFTQNASYVSVDSGPFSSLANPLFVKGILLLLTSLALIIFYLKRFISKELLFLSLWFGFSLFGALLSNRPYRHYLLQSIPPFILLCTYLIDKYFDVIKTRVINKGSIIALLTLTLIVLLLINYLRNMFAGAFALDTKSYYKNWFDYISERKSWEDYTSYFDSRTLNSYKIADYLKTNSQPTDTIFVWDDASFIYVLSERPPATKFIQAHHLSTIDPINYEQVYVRLMKFQPKFILVGRPVHFAFPKLEELIKTNYRQTEVIADMYIYQSRY